MTIHASCGVIPSEIEPTLFLKTLNQRRSFLRKISIARPTPSNKIKSQRNLEGSSADRFALYTSSSSCTGCCLLAFIYPLKTTAWSGRSGAYCSGQRVNSRVLCCLACMEPPTLWRTRSTPYTGSTHRQQRKRVVQKISSTLQSNSTQPTPTQDKAHKWLYPTPALASIYHTALPPKKPVPHSTSISSVRHRHT